MQKTWISFLNQEDPLEKEMQLTPVFLPGKSLGVEPGGLQFTELQETQTGLSN